MKVKKILSLLQINQEIEVHCKDYGKYCGYPPGFTGERTYEANILKIETGYNEYCKCTIVKIFTDLMMGE